MVREPGRPSRRSRSIVFLSSLLTATVMSIATATVQADPVPRAQSAPGGEQRPRAAVDVQAMPRQHVNSLEQFLSPSGLTPTLRVMVLLSLLSLAPALLIMTTSFVRFVIVFGLLRQALGTQQLPPTQVITSLSVFLTLFVMLPVWRQAWDEGIKPYVDRQPIPGLQADEDPLERVFHNTFRPVQRFMTEQIHRSNSEETVRMLVDYRRPEPGSPEAAGWHEPQYLDEVDPTITVTAFMLSELKTAFLIGFRIFLPFLVIDLVVSTLLTSSGMMMMPPTLVSLPFKILLFVLIDGWTLVTQMLLQSVVT